MRVPSAAVTIAWALSIAVLASVIDAETRSFLSSKDMSEVPAAWQILGEARSIVSNMSILQADLYLHGGAGHFFDEHEGGLAIGKSDSHDAHEDHEDHEHHDISHDNGTPAGLFNPLIRIADAVAVTEHKHLSGKEEAEIVPWLYFSARIDPSNTTAYTLTSYWLADRLGRPKEALAFLKQGLKTNADSWELNAETGRIYQQYFKDPSAAERYLERALFLMGKTGHDKFQERYVLTWLAEAKEGLGKHLEAADDYRRIEALFPRTTVYRDKIERLEDLAGNGGRGSLRK